MEYGVTVLFLSLLACVMVTSFYLVTGQTTLVIEPSGPIEIVTYEIQPHSYTHSIQIWNPALKFWWDTTLDILYVFIAAVGMLLLLKKDEIKTCPWNT